MKSNGRPTIYTPQLAAIICERLAAGESLRAICRDEGMPNRSTVSDWVIRDIDGFSGQYTRARDFGLDELADEILGIADNPQEGVRREESEDGYKEVREDMLGHRKLQVDARKWYLSKLAPKKYGEKIQQEITGANGGPLEISETDRAAKVAALIAQAQTRRDTDASDLI